MKKILQINGSKIGRIFSVALGLCFLGLLANVSNPSLHSKLHDLEDSYVFGQEDHHEEDHSSKETDHSNACHVCQLVSHFYSDIPAAQICLTTVLNPQELALNKGDKIIILTQVRPDSTRAPPFWS